MSGLIQDIEMNQEEGNHNSDLNDQDFHPNSDHLEIQAQETLSSPDEFNDASEIEMDFRIQLSDLPEEVLERILSYLSPYNDQDSAKLVCHQWNRLIKSIVKQFKRIFNQRLTACKVGWTEVVQIQARSIASSDSCFRLLSISDRYSHSCAYLNESMYVFGGCTSTNTTFNDLWRLDLTTRRWMRPVAMGSYPSPKACASMVVYKGKLVLFGGWSHPIPYPLHQSANYFSELHMYDPVTNRWSLHLSIGLEPDALGGHSASIVGDLMVVFGGSPRPGQGSNKIWVYDFVKSIWTNPKIKTAVCPEPRYGQYQCTIDDSHILIMGGCGGPNKFFSDLYVLTVETEGPWVWTKLQVQHPELAPRQTFGNAVSKVDNRIVVLCKSSKQRECLNLKPSVFQVENLPRVPRPSESRFNSSLLASSLPQCGDQPSPEKGQPSVQKTKSEESVAMAAPSLPVTVEIPGGACNDFPAVPSPNNRNLLALQQRLHREYVNLTDRDDHHHNSHPENTIPEGQIHRLQNRSNQNEDGNRQPEQHAVHPPPPPQPHHNPHNHHHHNNDEHLEPNQPHAGQFRRINPPPVREGIPMPSIRPNATSNRQKQLEALQRQEELLRTKSKALAAARKKSMESAAECPILMEEEEEVPSTVVAKNRMDIHIVDIASALTTGTAEWKPESPLQPPGAPMETLCCSLVEGRAELILFGGIGRETTFPMVQNTGLNRLYILHA